MRFPTFPDESQWSASNSPTHAPPPGNRQLRRTSTPHAAPSSSNYVPTPRAVPIRPRTEEQQALAQSTLTQPEPRLSAINAESNTGAVAKTRKKTKPRATRAGVLNYSSEDTSMLLRIVGKLKPYGASQWAEVAKLYQEWAEENERPPRDQDSLKNKFDKLCGIRKKTTDPTCPPAVRLAKQIARGIRLRCAVEARNNDDNDDADESEAPPNEDRERETDREGDVGGAPTVRRKRTRITTKTTPSKKGRFDERLVDCITEMAMHMGNISESLRTPANSNEAILGGNSANEFDFKKFLRDEVNEMKRTLRRDLEESQNQLAQNLQNEVNKMRRSMEETQNRFTQNIFLKMEEMVRRMSDRN